MQATTLKQLRQQSKKRLEIVYDAREASQIADWVIQESLGYTNNADLVVNANAEIASEKHTILQSHFERIESGEPVQYVLGKAYFCDLELHVAKGVLIPRPETEELVYHVFNFLEKTGRNKRILDIGTGSGCIPLALKNLSPESTISALDYSENALKQARDNAKNLELEVDFFRFDILDRTQWSLLDTVDILVSNPPYIPQNEDKTLAEHVLKWEPEMALFSPSDDSCLFYKEILILATSILAPEGKVFFELNPDTANIVMNFAHENGFSTELMKDLQHKERVLIATYTR